MDARIAGDINMIIGGSALVAMALHART